MINEVYLSERLNRMIHSPIRIGGLGDLQIDAIDFMKHFKPFFENLADDEYLVRANQINFLKNVFPNDAVEMEKHHKDFFHGKITIDKFSSWSDNLSAEQQQEFKQLSQITRQRNISSFHVEIENDEFKIERIYEEDFAQNVSDHRTWTRTFEQASKEAVENEMFFDLLKGFSSLVKDIHPEVKYLKFTSHFMRTIAQEKILGENSPEGIHEDGADYIVSALVINRQNVTGAESQVYELIDQKRDLIYNKELEPGEFIFQADTGEEKTFGNDLWHYVTPIEVVDSQNNGIRDIIGFDIDLM